MQIRTLFLAGLVLLPASATLSAQTFHGPLPYLSRSDSPFQDFVHFETFEDQVLNAPGLSVDNGSITSSAFPTLIDSVDADDGAIDGSGSPGDSWFYFSATTGLTWSFDSTILGGYPTRAGLVWTDGTGSVTFEAFDPSGQSLGSIGPIAVGDGAFDGDTAEDVFFGVESAGGISALRIFGTPSGIEVDHVQYAVTTGTAVQATETVRLGTPPNPDVLRESLATPPILGTLWSPFVDHSSFATGATLDFLAVDLGPPINVPLSIGTLLCTPPPTSQIFAVPAGGPFAVDVPNLIGLVGQSACTQAASLTPGAGVELTNALDVVLGTH